MRTRWMLCICLVVPGVLTATDRTARLTEPKGIVTDALPTFVWSEVEATTEYYLWVVNASGQQIAETLNPNNCTDGRCTFASPKPLDPGSYLWLVLASVPGRPDRWSSPRRFTISSDSLKPAKVELMEPSGVLDIATPTFVWKSVEEVQDYELHLSGVGNGTTVRQVYAESEICTHGLCTAPPTLTKLNLGDGSYSWWVRGRNLLGKGPRSDAFRIDVHTMPLAPERPVLVAPRRRVSETSPAFEWEVAERSTDYYLELRTGRDEILAEWYKADASLCNDTTCSVAPANLVLPHGVYHFRVTAMNTSGKSRPSRRMRFRVGDYLETPEPIAPEGVTNGTPKFEWSVVPDATYYVVRLRKDGTRVHFSRHDATNICNDSTCSTPLGKKLADGSYRWWVVAKSTTRRSGNASRSLYFDVTSGSGAPPGVPELIVPEKTVNTSTPTYRWKAVADATSYTLTVKDSSNPVLFNVTFTSAQAQCTIECQVTPAEPLEDGDYTFYVTASNAAGTGQPSAPADFKVETSSNSPPPKAVPQSPFGPVSNANPSFVWSAVAESARYTLVVDDSTGAPPIFQQTYMPVDAGCGTAACTVTPVLDLADGTYSFHVDTENAAGMVTLGDALSFTVVTSGAAELRVLSHMDGDAVADSGVLLYGTVGVGIVALTVQLDIGGTTMMPSRAVEISANGAWSVWLVPSQLSPGSAVVTFETTDGGGATTTTALNLAVAAADVKSSMLLERATFGASPALVDEARTNGTSAFQDRLLNPVPDPNFDAFVASLPAGTPDEVRQWALMHALFNPNALQEVLTQFWDNHFSTNMDSHDVPSYELDENIAFRQNALGRFRDVLAISAKSPAMLIYLDLTESTAAEPNENYPREVLELHTLGVDGGYTQSDVEELARILTGWKEVNGVFFFDAGEHDGGEKTFLGQLFPAGGGLDEGERALDMLSDHRSTAEFVCTKLVELFVSESPRQGLVDGCADVFQAEHRNGNSNQIREVVAFVLDSPDFVDPVNRRAKVKSPLELLCGVVRNLDATVEDRRDIERELRTLGMNLFHNRAPDGFPEVADEWIDTGLLLERVDFVNEVARNTGSQDTFVDIRQYFLTKGFETAEGVVGYLFDVAFQNELTDVELAIAFDILTDSGSSPFDINGVDAEARLRRLVATVFSFPGYQHQ